MDSLTSTEKEINITVPWGNIAGLTWGDPANPPVLLVHGKMHACSVFRPLVSLLPSCFYYVAFDLPSNGRSDHLPPGPKFSIMDLVPSVYFVVKHFEWKKFMYIGHSLGVIIGKYFNIAYPGYITRIVELDPIPAYHSWGESGDTNIDAKTWFLRYYHTHYADKYQVYSKGPETAPTYTYEQIVHMFDTTGVEVQAAKHLFERILEPVGNGLYRFTYDQRMKEVPVPAYTPQHLHRLYSQTKTPILCILAQRMVNLGMYQRVPFVMNESAWPHNNYRFCIVEGGHDVHLTNPERVAKRASEFLLEEVKAKL